VRDKSTVWIIKGWIFKVLSYCVLGRTVCFLRGGVRLCSPRVPFSGTSQLLRPSYFIGSCYLAALLSALGDNASVRFVYPLFIVFSANPVWRSKSYLSSLNHFSSPRKQPTLRLMTRWIVREFVSTNQKHYLDLGSDASSVWNFCSRYSDVVLRGFKWRPRETSAVFLVYHFSWIWSSSNEGSLKLNSVFFCGTSDLYHP